MTKISRRTLMKGAGAAALATVLTWALLSSRAANDTVSVSRMSPSRLSL